MASFIHYFGKIWGVEKSLAEILPTCREYVDDGTFGKFIENMDESGVDISVLFYSDNVDDGLDDERVMKHNASCADISKRHPERIIAVASIDPRRPRAPLLFRTCLEEYGMQGLKWHPDYGYYPNSEEAYRVLEVASEFSVPLITHTGPLPHLRSKYSHPLHLDDVALDFPKLDVIAAHMGDTWWRDWASLAKYKKNIYGDLAVWQLMAESNMPKFRRTLREIIDTVGVEQILFGSDEPAFEPLVSKRRWVEILKNLPSDTSGGIRFTDDEITSILGGNAARIFNLR